MGLISATVSGGVSTWLPLICAAILAWIFMRGGGATAIASLQAANQQLEKRVHELEDQVKDNLKVIAELKSRTDYSAVIDGHEQRAAERHEKTLAVLERIAARLDTTP